MLNREELIFETKKYMCTTSNSLKQYDILLKIFLVVKLLQLTLMNISLIYCLKLLVLRKQIKPKKIIKTNMHLKAYMHFLRVKKMLFMLLKI